MPEPLKLKKIADLETLKPGVYEGVYNDTLYTVTVGPTGASTTTRPAKTVMPPPLEGGWKVVEKTTQIDFQDGQIQLIYPAQKRAVEMRLRVKWMPFVAVRDEFEPFALVRRKGTRPMWPDLPLYYVLRAGNARLRTGVGGIKMDDKATDEKRWKPEIGKVHHISARIDLEGTAYLEIDGPSGERWSWTTARPEEGRPGPWPWDLMVQLGGPAGKVAGHGFSDVVLEVREDA